MVWLSLALFLCVLLCIVASSFSQWSASQSIWRICFFFNATRLGRLAFAPKPLIESKWKLMFLKLTAIVDCRSTNEKQNEFTAHGLRQTIDCDVKAIAFAIWITNWFSSRNRSDIFHLYCWRCCCCFVCFDCLRNAKVNNSIDSLQKTSDDWTVQLKEAAVRVIVGRNDWRRDSREILDRNDDRRWWSCY